MKKMGQGTLDDPASIAAFDPGGMLSLAGELGDQLRTGFRAGTASSELPSGEGLRSVVVCGMGGSGVAGDILKVLFAPRLPMPIVVCKGYAVPEFCGRDTLAIAVSFSGDTEETVAAYLDAVARGARVATISGGGELASHSDADGVARVAAPTEIPVPRAALGYLTGAAIGILDRMGLVPPAADLIDESADHLESVARSLRADLPADANQAKSLAAWLLGGTPVIWGSEGLAEAAAVRWKTQLNENAKIPAFHGVIPELDHNEIEGWGEDTVQPYRAVVLRHRGEHPRVATRIAATMDAVSRSGMELREVQGEGASPLAVLLSLIMVGDFTSTYLAILRRVDPLPVPVLTDLKARLRE